MMGRRSFMALLGAAPMAAGSQLRATRLGIPASDCSSVGESPMPDPVFDQARRFLDRRRDNAFDKLHNSGHHLPPKIACKKSWSPVFKVHVFTEEKRKLEDLHRFHELDRDALIRLALKYGADL